MGIRWSKNSPTKDSKIKNDSYTMWAFGDLWVQWLSFTSTSWWNQTVGCTTPNKLAHFFIKSSYANMEVSRMGFSSQSYLQSKATAPTCFQISLKLRFILQIFGNMCHKFELLMWYLFRIIYAGPSGNLWLSEAEQLYVCGGYLGTSFFGDHPSW